MNAEQEKTALQKIEDVLKKFWMDQKKSRLINARHTEVLVEPKVFIGGSLNQEISKLLIQEYLGKISADDIAKGRVTITSELIRIFDHDGTLIAEVRGKRMIEDTMRSLDQSNERLNPG